MGRAFILSVCVLVALSFQFGASMSPQEQQDADLITNLPKIFPQPTFKQYSGYIPVNDQMNMPIDNNTRHLHYWFVESQNNPSTDPVVLWLNGGPGCSSLLGLLTENGPFRFNQTADNDNLHYNTHSWNKIANVLYLEQPSGVGFSWGGNYTSGDNIARNDNFHFLFGWFARFNQYQSHSFYIAGESYAGQYIPQLAHHILTTPTPSGFAPLNLKGILVGNPSGLTGTDFAHSGYMFLRQHALISELQLDNIKQVCNMSTSSLWPSDPSSSSSSESTACQEAENALWQRNLKGIDPYNILTPCLGDGPGQQAGCATQQRLQAYLEHATSNNNVQPGGSTKTHHPIEQTFVPCGDYSRPLEYLHSDPVKTALHISPNALAWDMCSQVLKYDQYTPGTPSLYQQMNGKIQMWVYSGDLDTCVPYLITQYAVFKLGFTLQEDMKPWFQADTASGTSQIAGYATSYSGFTYVTVKGAGHMVPTDKPAQAFTMFQSFLKGQFP